MIYVTIPGPEEHRGQEGVKKESEEFARKSKEIKRHEPNQSKPQKQIAQQKDEDKRCRR